MDNPTQKPSMEQLTASVPPLVLVADLDVEQMDLAVAGGRSPVRSHDEAGVVRAVGIVGALGHSAGDDVNAGSARRFGESSLDGSPRERAGRQVEGLGNGALALLRAHEGEVLR
jgi:hypothetical protein